MLDMLEWIKKHGEGPADPGRNPASAAALLADLRGADPTIALDDLSGRLESVNDAAGVDQKARSEVLALIQEAGAAHVSALLAQYLANPAATQAARESAWKFLVHYLSRLTQALCASAEGLIEAAKEDASLLPPGATSAARGLRACRTLAKICLVHYSSVPRKLWRLAYSVHAQAEKAGCATSPVSPHSGHKTVTTVAQELLRLLMLQVSAPDMMAPQQIEVADRVTEQLGGDFTLRPLGVADNPSASIREEIFLRGGRSARKRSRAPTPATSVPEWDSTPWSEYTSSWRWPGLRASRSSAKTFPRRRS
jgi:hypothetical protein